MEKLTNREIELISFLAKGFTTRAIAKLMSIHPNTIRTYLNKIFLKTNTKNRNQLIAETVKQGII